MSILGDCYSFSLRFLTQFGAFLAFWGQIAGRWYADFVIRVEDYTRQGQANGDTVAVNRIDFCDSGGFSDSSAGQFATINRDADLAGTQRLPRLLIAAIFDVLSSAAAWSALLVGE
jgi:hypothetical protein